MRRSLLCLSVMLVAGWIAFRFGTVSSPQQHLAAQERSAAAVEEAAQVQVADATEAILDISLDRFVVPVTAEVDALVQYVKVLKKQRPTDGPARKEYDEKAPIAIRRACEQILRLDRDAHSDSHRFAQRELRSLAAIATRNDGPYPMFNVRDILEELTTTGARLMKAGKTRSDHELRKGLDRESTEITLPPAQHDEISDRDLYRRACESVFIVCSLYKVPDTDDWETSLASAFAVTEDGVLSTSCHVFDNEDDADAVIVMDIHKNIYAVQELLAADAHADTCLFRIDAKKVTPLPLADDAVPGTRIRILGHPGDSFYFFSNGTLANYERDSDGATWMNVTADFGQGSSGGPVMDEYGNVVGQVSRTYTLYAGGPATRGRPRRVQGDKPSKEARASEEKAKGSDDIADPQMVFKSCVTVKTLRSLVKPKQAGSSPN